MKINEILSEGLITSSTDKEVIKKIKKTFPEVEIRTADNVKHGYGSLTVHYGSDNVSKISAEQKAQLKQMLAVMGWYVAKDFEEGEEDYDDVVKDFPFMTIEPKYDAIATHVPTTLYHITAVKYVDRILKSGLTPRSGNRKSEHPNRVYLAVTEADAKEILGQLMDVFDRKGDATFAVDTTKLPSSIKFYQDRNFFKREGKKKIVQGLYTTEPIPPSALTLIAGAPASPEQLATIKNRAIRRRDALKKHSETK